MNELISKFIGKNCVIRYSDFSSVTGTVVSVNENWIEVKDAKGNSQLLNLDYINRITEHKVPNKNRATY